LFFVLRRVQRLISGGRRFQSHLHSTYIFAGTKAATVFKSRFAAASNGAFTINGSIDGGADNPIDPGRFSVHGGAELHTGRQHND
jgi:hypothetical protein